MAIRVAQLTGTIPPGTPNRIRISRLRITVPAAVRRIRVSRLTVDVQLEELPAPMLMRRGGQWVAVKSFTTGGDPTAPVSAITHGRQVTALTTGPEGMGLSDPDLVSTSASNVNGLVRSGRITGYRFTGTPNLRSLPPTTFVGCKFDNAVLDADRHTLRFCSVGWPNPSVIPTVWRPGDCGVGFTNVTVEDSRVGGFSDGGKMNGGCTWRRSLVRVIAQNSNDHCDGLQNNGGVGDNVVDACNIDTRSADGTTGENAALFSADGARGTETWTNNLLAGGGFVIRAYENCDYVISGNDVLDQSWLFGPADAFFVDNEILVWSGNVLVAANQAVTPLSVPASPRVVLSTIPRPT